MTSALLVGSVGAALTACASGEQQAEDKAVAKLKSQLSGLEDSARSFLRSSPERESARERFAVDHGSEVFASSISGNVITWKIALVGQGDHSNNLSSTSTRLRTCLQIRSSAALELSLTTIPCPAKFTSSPNFDSTDRDINLLDELN